MNLSMDPPPTLRQRLWSLTVEVHKHLDTYLGYLVAASITLQESWAQMDDYIPAKWRHAILAAAVFIVWLDRTRRAVKATG
jgi:hypothetical protein